MEKAGFWIRFIACVVDGLVVGLIQWPIGLIFLPFQSDDPFNPNLSIILIQWILQLAVSISYFCYFLSKKGATPGKMCFNLRVVDTKTGKNVSAGKAFAREFIGKFLSSLVFGLGFICVAWRSNKNAWHDDLCHTQVVRVR